MKHSEDVEKWVKTKLGHSHAVAPEVKVGGAEPIFRAKSVIPSETETEEKEEEEEEDANVDFKHPTTFRTSILHLLTSKGDLLETAGVAFVAKIKGDVEQVRRYAILT